MPQVRQVILDGSMSRYNASWAHERAGIHHETLLLAVAPAGQPGGETRLDSPRKGGPADAIVGRFTGSSRGGKRPATLTLARALTPC